MSKDDNTSPRRDDWLRYVPSAERGERLRTIRRLRLGNRLRQRSLRIVVLLLLYILICASLIPLVSGVLVLLAVLPLILAPPLGYLVYWLTWKEFND